MVQYVSTRGPGPGNNFLDVMMAGMAPDGGLYLPGKVESAVEGVRAATFDYISKPFDDGDVMTTVERARASASEG